MLKNFNNNEKYNSKLIIQYIIICILFFILIELIHRQDLKSIYNFLSSNNIYIYLYLILFFIFSSLYTFIFKKPLIFCAMHYSVWCFIAFISNVNIYFKGSPLIFEDLFLVNEATNIISKYLNTKLITNVLILIILFSIIFIIVVKISKNIKFKLFNLKYRYLNFILYTLFIYIYLLSMDKLYNYGKSITYVLSDFNLSDTYFKNGFLHSFYDSTTLFFSNNKNLDYDIDKILKIKNMLSENDYNFENPDVNIILIQLESIFDPLKLKDVKFSNDPLKNLRNLSKINESGEIIVPVLGGGTIQSEFEILTGINIKNLYTKMPYLNLLNNTQVESIPYILKNYGYSTTAIHNYFSTFYNRTKAYENIGFETFIPIEAMTSREISQNFWYKDNILINEIITKIKNTPEKDFIFGVTVESHGPYNTLINGDIVVESNSLSEKDLIELQNYANIIKHVDDFILNLINELNNTNEEYILILYGDHLPSLGENQSTFSSLTKEDLFKTPYLIIESNNKKMISIDKNTEIHAYEFLYEIFSDLNINSTIYHRFREIFKEDTKYNDYEKQLILDIKKQNIYDNSKFPYEISPIKIGNNTQIIEDININNDGVFIIGNGFTENSKILVNGKKIDTQYISTNCLKSINYIPNNEDVFIVILFSNKNSPLNISNKFIF
ncbi:Putative membrane protein [Candidatus Arthromitus sp. SFB-mouse-SU]|nr:Putative membrane protein [Candidatus Arthromitus sp. SFB-5]EIA28956.1 Putative membrane protein [Candidatus Arthromitus sp. SFB-co]EIA29730.1 Putative membrane protein [Candidatus Arthromitus sp. SFB-mouse-SU]